MIYEGLYFQILQVFSRTQNPYLALKNILCSPNYCYNTCLCKKKKKKILLGTLTFVFFNIEHIN